MMVKLFFAGIVVFTLAMVGAFAAFFGPLLIGIDNNLGNPQSPFHNPVPQPVIDWLNNTVGQANAQMVLWGMLAISALLLVYSVGMVVSYLVHRWRCRQAYLAELRWRGRVNAARATQSPPTQATAEFESVWE